METAGTIRWPAIVALAAILYFLVAAVATHVVSPQYDFVRDYISDYAVGPWGWIYGSAFLASCIGSIALALALWRTVPRAALSRTGLVLLAIVGVTYAVDFAFPTDILPPGQPPQTVVGMIHFADAFLGWVLFVVCAFLISARLKHDAYWARRRGTLLALAWIAVVLLLALVAVLVSKRPVGGLAEKAFILDRNIWALLMALSALNAPARCAPPDGGFPCRSSRCCMLRRSSRSMRPARCSRWCSARCSSSGGRAIPCTGRWGGRGWS
ncbi:MAG: DUF998 domain-containing protein [Bauldia sp.]